VSRRLKYSPIGGTQEHFRIEYFLGIVINQDTGETRRRNAVGQRGRNKTAGTDADKDIRLMNSNPSIASASATLAPIS
jgi:hypothetical protein